MKTAISLPDDLFEQAERLAYRLKKKRSTVYSEALAEYLARHDLDAVTEAMNRVADAVGTHPDGFVTGAARRILESEEW